MDSFSLPSRMPLDTAFPPESAKKESSFPPGLLIDITHSQGIHEALFGSAPDSMIVTNGEGQILEMNAEAEKQFGYRREELIGQAIEKLIPSRFRECHERQRAAYQQAPTYRPMARGVKLFGMRRDGGEFPADIALSPVRTDHGTLYYCVIRDVSCREAALAKVQHHLKLEHALAGLSGKFINLPASQVDQEITAGLQLLVEALDTDRASLGQIEPLTGDLVVTHSYARPGIPPFGERIPKTALPWFVEHVRTGRIVNAPSPDDLPNEAVREREYAKIFGIKSNLAVPIRVIGEVVGGISTSAFRQSHQWDDYVVSRFLEVADIFGNALARKRGDEELQKATAEIQDLKHKLQQQNTYLRQEIDREYPDVAMVGSGQVMRRVLEKAEKVAKTDAAVLILGETGTGKELLARTIHGMSKRRQNPMVKVNCASLPATLIESELFGREKGAYTGALAREIGRFELADKSTLFLDEIGELPMELQPKLLRVLQEGEFERLGSSKTIRADVRIIAATNRNLQALVQDGKFREDLFFRLNVFPISIPPLRDRPEDIPAITYYLLRDLAKRFGINIEQVHPSTLRDFQRYSWPGNVRELRNVIERNLILNSGPVLRAELSDLDTHKAELRRLEEIEVEHLRKVLHSTHWRIRGRGGAAEILGLKPTTLEARMKKLSISRHE